MPSTLATFALTSILVSAAAGCGGADGEEGALERALQRALPVQASVAPGERVDSTWEPPVPLAALTAHRVEAMARLELTFGDKRHELVVHRSIARKGRRFRFVERRVYREPSLADPTQQRTSEGRFEALFDGERLAVRRGAGPFIERDARDGLPARLLTRHHDLVPSVLAAFGDYFLRSASPGRAPVVAGLSLTWSALSLDPGVRPRVLAEAELQALRDHETNVFAWAAATLRPTRVVGRLGAIAIEGARGAADSADVAECELSLAGGVRGAEGAAGGFALDLQQRLGTLDEAPLPGLFERADADFTWPTDVLPADRPRPWKMIEDVLGDELLDPYRPQR